MQSSDLTPDQINRIFAKIAPIAHFLARVKARMIELDFPLGEDACQLLKGFLAVRSSGF